MMGYRFDFRKKYTKRNTDMNKPLEPAKEAERKERERRKMLLFLKNWFKGRIICNEYKKILVKFKVFHLVQNGEIEEAKKILLES